MISPNEIQIDRDKGNFHYQTDYEFDAGVGLSEDVVRYISNIKEEDKWLLDFRLRALSIFERKPLPTHWSSRILKILILTLSATIFPRGKSLAGLGMRSQMA